MAELKDRQLVNYNSNRFPSDFDDMYAMSERNSRIQIYANIWTQKSLNYRRRKMQGLTGAAEVVVGSDD